MILASLLPLINLIINENAFYPIKVVPSNMEFVVYMDCLHFHMIYNSRSTENASLKSKD